MSADRVGTYEIVRMLARGGMATVYLVRQPALDRDVVLKRLDLQGRDPVLAQRFVREARLAATLDHPNVVTLFDFFEHDGVPYIAMEYVAGGSLRALVGRLELPQVCGVVEGVLAGLQHAEARRIAHRDLKPENLLLTRRGNVKIADFGIARAYDEATHRLTVPGVAIGTPTYMAPEQATNERLGPTTDLYSLGVIVYELLAGRPPFLSDTPVGLLYAHVHTPPPPLAALVDPGHAGVARWVEWLLAKDPDGRPPSAAAAWGALEELAVAEMGPYWRRDAAITAPLSAAAPPEVPAGDAEETTEESRGRATKVPTTPTPLAPPRVLPRSRRRRRRAVTAAGGATVLAGAAIAMALAVSPGGRGRPSAIATPARTPASPPRAATAYDFDGDGRPELVLALLKGAPRGRRVHSGAVLVQRPGRKPAWRLITEPGAGLRGDPHDGDDFGSGLASADFDRDGNADLAIGTPGRDRVSVVYGSAAGPDGRRTQQLRGGSAGLGAGAGRYGYTLVARDLDHDGFGDLVIGAPGPEEQPSTGAVHIVYGGRHGLRPERARVLGRPEPGMSNFGERLRTGDVDDDGKPDLAEGASAPGTDNGHATWCRSGNHGPLRCRPLPEAGNTSALAVGDVNGDGHADIIQGDSQHVDAKAGAPLGAGLVRIWPGSHDGPRPAPLVITQNTPTIDGRDEPGDEFGAVVETGYVDLDRYADIVVSAPRENAGAGAVWVIRGGRSGWAHAAHGIFDQSYPSVPGDAAPDREFGSTLAVLRVGADRRPRVVLAVRGADSVDERLMVIAFGRGAPVPDETKTRLLPGVASLVDAPAGTRIRLARTAGG